MSAPDSTSKPTIRAPWLTFFVGALLLSWVVVLVWTMHDNQINAQQKELRTLARFFAADIQIDLNARLKALQRMADRWTIRGGTPIREFIKDAEAYVADMPGLQAIEWVDSDYHVRWVIPLAGNEEAVNLNLAAEEKRRIALERARVINFPTMSSPVDLVQGGKGFLVYFPLVIRGEFDGFLLAVFNFQEWLDHIYIANEEQQHIEDVRFSLSIQGEEVFKQADWDKSGITRFEEEFSHRIMSQQFRVRVRPIGHFFENTSTLFTSLAGIVGVVVSILVAFVVHYYLKASAEAREANRARRVMEEEVREREDAERKLQQVSSRLTLATRAGRIGVWDWDVATNRLRWDDRMFELYDIPPDVVPKYETWSNSLHPEDKEAAETLLQDAVAGRAKFETEFRIQTYNGGVRYISAAADVHRDEDGAPVSMIGVNWDITLRRLAEEQLKTERRRLADIIRGTNVGTWEWNVQTGEVVFNERWADIIGYSLRELEPTSIETWMSYAHPDDLEKSGELLEKHFSGELQYYECEARMRHKNGNWVWVLDRGKVASWTEDGKPLLMSGTHKDITAQKRAEEKIRHLATHDTLTDLPTLRLARDRTEMALAAAARKGLVAAVLFVDLDGFKQVNDTLGHDAGDVLLKETANRLTNSVRHMDTVARIGGDEFVVMLQEGEDRETITGMIEKLQRAISKVIVLEGREFKLGASVGVCIYPDDASDLDDLINFADAAMYRAKDAGPNAHVFYEDSV